MNIFRFIFTTILLICSARYLVNVLGEICLSRWDVMFLYLQQWVWIVLGAGVYALIHKWIGEYLEWLETFSHEFTHAAVAIFSFNKVTEFVVHKTYGHIKFLGEDSMLITLSPYCFPIFTFITLCFHRLVAHEYMTAYEMGIGCTLAFHFFCFKSQTGNWQEDINNYPRVVSYLFIGTLWVTNTALILGALAPGQNLWTSIVRYALFVYYLVKPIAIEVFNCIVAFIQRK